MRIASLVIALTAVFGPTSWAYMASMNYSKAAQAEHQFVCGMPILAFTMLAAFASAALSLVAVVLGWLSYRSLPRPRPRGRAVELAALLVPLIVFTAYASVLFTTW